MTVLTSGVVDYLIGLLVTVLVVFVPFILAVLPGIRDTRFLQAANDHSMAEYERLISDAYHPDVRPRKVTTWLTAIANTLFEEVSYLLRPVDAIAVYLMPGVYLYIFVVFLIDI